LFFHFLVLGGCAVGRFFYSEARQNVKMFRKNVKKAPRQQLGFSPVALQVREGAVACLRQVADRGGPAT
jgi:hypothetical protein